MKMKVIKDKKRKNIKVWMNEKRIKKPDRNNEKQIRGKRRK